MFLTENLIEALIEN